MCYRCKYQVPSTGPNRLEVCLYNLSVSTCEFVTTNPISLCIFKVSPELSLLAHTLCVRAAKTLVKFLKNAQAYWIRDTCDKWKISCTDAYIRVDKLYKHTSVYLGQWTIPDTCICSTSAQKAELKVVGVLGWDRDKCASVYMGSSVWNGLVVDWGISADTLIIHTFPSAPACTGMVSSKELERDVTTNAMAKEPPRLKTLASFLHSTWSVRYF